MPPSRFAVPAEVPGLAARRIAADILDGVLHKHRTLDDQLDGAGAHPGLKSLADRDRALMRRLVATILRRLGTLGHLLSRLLDRGVPTDAPRAQSALLIGAAQILWMDVPDHAAVDLSVRLVQSDRRAAKYAGLVNAVLRRCAREGQPLIDEVKAQTLDIPPWLLARWIAAYGETTAREMAIAIGHEPSLDITVKSDAPQWATRLHGETLPTGNRAHPAAGLGDDAARLHRGAMVGAGRRRRTAGAAVRRRQRQDASSISAPRPAARPRSWRRPARASPRSIARRRGWRGCATIFRGCRCRPMTWWPMPPNGRAATARSTACWWMRPAPRPAPSGAIPTWPGCARKPTSRALTALQIRLLKKAVALLKPGGTLVYCTCSLEPEEGEQAVAALLATESGVRRAPVDAGEVAGLAEIVTADGDLRTLPCHLPHDDPRLGGLDGFYAARLVKS